MYIPKYVEASNIKIWEGYNHKLNISRATFTGADDACSYHHLNSIRDEYQFIEWGILYSPSRAGNGPRCPSISNIIKFINNINGSMAIHLCGGGVNEFINGKGPGYELATNVIDRNGRVQVNVNFGSLTETKKLKLVESISKNNNGSFILQMNDSNKDILRYFAGVYNYSVLFDGSGGRGEQPSNWPFPYDGIKCGYAGGLGPISLEKELRNIKVVAGMADIWVDMESKIRTDEDDCLDLSKCLQCAGIIADMRVGGNKFYV